MRAMRSGLCHCGQAAKDHPMFENKRIAVIVPSYKEETQIRTVIETMPDFVDCIIIVDDKSP